MQLSSIKLEKILNPKHFEIDYDKNLIKITISSDSININEETYNNLISSLTFEKQPQSEYARCLMSVNNGLKKTSAKRMIRQLRFMWENNPIFGIEVIREGDGPNTPVYLKCREHVLLNIQSIAPASKFFN